VADEQTQPQDRTSPAFKAGEAAHEIVNGAEKAAKAAGRKIDESARKAREGWKEKAREDRLRDRQTSDHP
jgi:vacuolar-type H+-ATPase subunit H